MHSKRFIVSAGNLQELKQSIGELEYLIEFRLTDPGLTSEFTQATKMPDFSNAGPVVTYGLFQVLNAMTDGVIAAVIILVSLVLILIAMLCIRFTMLATIEEDYREISVMKAIGIAEKDIKRLYLMKYVFMAGFASVLDHIASLGVNRLFVSNIMLYMGKAPATLLHFRDSVISRWNNICHGCSVLSNSTAAFSFHFRGGCSPYREPGRYTDHSKPA